MKLTYAQLQSITRIVNEHHASEFYLNKTKGAREVRLTVTGSAFVYYIGPEGDSDLSAKDDDEEDN